MNKYILLSILISLTLSQDCTPEQTPCGDSSSQPLNSTLGILISPNQIHKSPKKAPLIREEHLNGKNPLGVSDAAWADRCELAATYRGLYLYGFGDDLAAQCLMFRSSENDSEFYIAEWGIFFEEVTASNLLLLDFDGNIVDPITKEKQPVLPDVGNMGCIPVAKAILEARPDMRIVAHVHPKAIMAVAGMKEGLLPLSQAAFFFHGVISREEYDFSYESSFEDNLAKGFSLGQRAMLLNHHGIYAIGKDCAEAFFVVFYVNQACEVQIMNTSMNGERIIPDSDLLTKQYKDMMESPDYSYDGSREWAGLVRKVQRSMPDFNM